MGDGRARRPSARRLASNEAFDITTFRLGLALVVAAIAGGSVKAMGFEIPVIASLARQIALGIVGGLVIGVSFRRGKSSHSDAGVERRPRRLHAVMPSEVVRNEWTQVQVQVTLPHVGGLRSGGALPDAGAAAPPLVHVSPVPVAFPRAQTGVVMPATVDVHVDGQLFEIPKQTHRMTVLPVANSGVVVVDVRPLRTSAAAVIVVRATQKLQSPETVVLGSASLTTRIVPERATQQVGWSASVTSLGETERRSKLMRPVVLLPNAYMERRRAGRSVTSKVAGIAAVALALYLLYRLLEGLA